jgi:hypothetical protein
LTYGDPPPAQAVLAELLIADGAKILAPRLRRDVRTFAPLLEEYGELTVVSIKTVRQGDIDRSTIDEWAKVHEDFSLALARAKVLEQRWWEDVGQSGLTDKSFQGSLWSRSMAARFPHEWRETANVNHGVQDSLGDLLSSIDGKSRGIPTARS